MGRKKKEGLPELETKVYGVDGVTGLLRELGADEKTIRNALRKALRHQLGMFGQGVKNDVPVGTGRMKGTTVADARRARMGRTRKKKGVTYYYAGLGTRRRYNGKRAFYAAIIDEGSKRRMTKGKGKYKKPAARGHVDGRRITERHRSKFSEVNLENESGQLLKKYVDRLRKKYAAKQKLQP